MDSKVGSYQELSGSSGYNTDLALNVLPEFMPTLKQAHVRFLV
jgi:hypothetical protein